MNSTPLWLTDNTDSIYALLALDLKKDGPTVIKIPPGVMGPIDADVPLLRTRGGLLQQDLQAGGCGVGGMMELVE